MKLSINSCESSIHTGHGYVSFKLLSKITRTGHSVLLNRAAPYEMNFSHPTNYMFFSDSSYKIGYTAWESTELPDGWAEAFEKVDEIWTPNKFGKMVFESHTDKPVYIFPHGVDEVFETKQREITDTLKFLHVGHPALRKNLPETIESFLELYAGRKDVTLTVKSYKDTPVAGLNEPNINVIPKTVTYQDMVKIFHSHHVLLYPSWGEGFGLLPLQALATGMPAIMTRGWADYDHYIPDLMINSDLKFSMWQNYHPGKMFRPDIDHFKSIMIYAENNIDTLLNRHHDLSHQIHKEWSWEKVIKDHFDAVEARLVV